MKVFSYTKSPTLEKILSSIEEKRKELLLTPISPKDKITLRWNALIDKIHFALLLEGESFDKNQVAELLSPLGKKRLSTKELLATEYKKGLDILYQRWLVSKTIVTADDAISLYSELFNGKLRIQTEDLSQNLEYLQIKPEHPVVQAALVYILIQGLRPFSSHNTLFSLLFSLLFLYREGFDFLGLVNLEEYFSNDRDEYQHMIELSLRQENITSWLEYVANGTLSQLNKVLEKIHTTQENTVETSQFDLNDRQREILSILDEPGRKISNKEVQKIYKVSQITASRDLAKLSSLRLVFTIGKGRSTYYTKI